MKKDNILLITALILIAIASFLFIKSFKFTATQVPISNKKNISLPSFVKNSKGYYSVESAAFEKLTKKENVTVVNVHIPYAGEIEGTDEFIPYNEIQKNISRLPKNKNEKIAIYCRSGGMSAVASEELVKLGYTNVYDLTGGMNAYKTSGRTVLIK